MSTSDAAAPCTSHASVWQWRQSTSFSSTKKSRMPAEHSLEDTRRRQLFQRFGQQGEQRHAEQRSDGVAHQPREEPGPDRVGKEQQDGGQQQPAQAAEQAQADGGQRSRHAGGF